MKNLLVVAAIAALAGTASAVDLALWTFELNTPADVTDFTTVGPVTADSGVNAAGSVGTGVHASALSDWTTPVGNGSANSLSANGYAIGDYFDYRVSTAGYTGIQLSWDHTSSNTGPRDWDVQISTNGGGSFSSIFNYSVLANATPNPVWNSTTGSALYSNSISLGAGADNLSQLIVRMTVTTTVSANGGTVAATGTSRQDNVLISGIIPTPGAVSLLGVAGIAAIRRRRA